MSGSSHRATQPSPHSESTLLAVALAGESTFWLCEPRGSKPLPEDWKSADCRWLYPVESGLTRFTEVSGFDAGDVVFELGVDGVSKVERFATLAANVPAKKQRVGRGTFFFVPPHEMQRVEELYRALLRRESQLPPSAPPTTPPPPPPATGQEEGNEETTGETPPAVAEAVESPKGEQTASADEAPMKTSPIKTEEGQEGEEEVGGFNDRYPQPQHALPRDRNGEEADSNSNSDSDSDSDDRLRPSRHHGGGSNYYIGSHKRKTPHVGTTVYIAPVSDRAMGTHASSEAFGWEHYFIVHRGSVDYVCPAATGNTYGFRLDKVTHYGVPVFLLFGNTIRSSYDIDPNANGVPALETAVLRGEGGEGRATNTVLVLTRRAGEKHVRNRDGDAEGEEAEGTATATTDAGSRARRVARPTTTRRPHRRIYPREFDSDSTTSSPTSSETEESDIEEDDDDVPLLRVAQRASRRKAAAAAAAAQPSASSAASSRRREAQRQRFEEPQIPLQAVSVNLWADPDHTVPTASQLSKQFPFAHDPATPLRTAVFPDGTCVTYTPASAVKVGAGQEKRASTKSSGHGGGATASSTAPTGNPADVDMRSLLEHIQLAKEQVNQT